MENNKPYKNENGKWVEADGSPYIVKEGETPPWLVNKGFQSRPEDIWRGGKGKTTLASLAKSWESQDSPEISKEHLQRIFRMMMGQSIREVEKIAKDKNAPMAVVMLARGVVDGKNPEKVFQDMLIWLYGKEVETIEVKTSASTEGVTEELREQIKQAALRKIS